MDSSNVRSHYNVDINERLTISSLREPRQRRRRRLAPTASTTHTSYAAQIPSFSYTMASLPLALLVSSLIFSSKTNVSAAERIAQSHTPQDNVREKSRELSPEFKARIRSLKQATLDRWKSDPTAYKRLRPLDLVIDDSEGGSNGGGGNGGDGDGSWANLPRAYQVGAGGFLEPYDMENYQDGKPVISVLGSGGSSSNVGSDGGGGGGGIFSLSSSNVVHHQATRVGLTNFDIKRGVGKHTRFEDEETVGRTRSLRGVGVGGVSDVSEGGDGTVPNLDSKLENGFFIYSEFDDPHDLDINEAAPYDARHLERTAATDFANHRKGSKNQGRNNDYKSDFDHSSNMNTKTGLGDTDAPICRATFPPDGSTVGFTQSFGALVSDNGSGVTSVCVQFRDHTNKRSDCFPLTNVGSDVWELSFDGFGAFPGMVWSFRMKSKDGAGNKSGTGWTTFTIAASAAGVESNNEDKEASGESTSEAKISPTSSPTTQPTTSLVFSTLRPTSGPTSSPTGQTAEKAPPSATPLLEEVADENWPYGGLVQVSTGRLLFFMGGGSYVCSASVVDDGDQQDDRTILVTAGHCAYQYRPASEGGGRFAEMAYFIPNQVDTTDSKTNEECDDDPLGCWIPAFAVVASGWTENVFPSSVQWDYAYYVIPNDPDAHYAGYLPTGSGVLERDVAPIPVDYDFDEEKFVHGLGYSFNKDPDFRYCADDISTKNGIDTYTNLWIPACRMTGGASGGPWMKDMDSDGRGVIISVNSWGYTTSPGMAGPNLSTQSGSMAECMYQVAKSADFNAVENFGIIVDPDVDC